MWQIRPTICGPKRQVACSRCESGEAARQRALISDALLTIFTDTYAPQTGHHKRRQGTRNRIMAVSE